MRRRVTLPTWCRLAAAACALFAALLGTGMPAYAASSTQNPSAVSSHHRGPGGPGGPGGGRGGSADVPETPYAAILPAVLVGGAIVVYRRKARGAKAK
ncbi:MAG: hypothetical protein K6T78_06595 [Alicyclobacillus sp.]|nr:hypothetical protein [Alicyclobacillus sp.]